MFSYIQLRTSKRLYVQQKNPVGEISEIYAAPFFHFEVSISLLSTFLHFWLANFKQFPLNVYNHAYLGLQL